jgi:hypothetical protein
VPRRATWKPRKIGERTVTDRSKSNRPAGQPSQHGPPLDAYQPNYRPGRLHARCRHKLAAMILGARAAQVLHTLAAFQTDGGAGKAIVQKIAGNSARHWSCWYYDGHGDWERWLLAPPWSAVMWKARPLRARLLLTKP